MVTDSFIELIQKNKLTHEGEFFDYETPLVTVDIVLCSVIDNKLKVLLIKRLRPPFEHQWAIPGGFIHVGETLEEAAKRRLGEETNVENVFLEQLGAFGATDRDPRARVITVGYFALVSADKLVNIEAHANAEDVGWFCVSELPALAFDHESIVGLALRRLKAFLSTSPVAFQLLPDKFTLTELQKVYELILEKPLDKRNFRKKIISSNILLDTGETKMDGYHRPAQLFSFNYKEGVDLAAYAVS